MFKVINTDSPKDKTQYTVYDIRYNNAGYPHFLFYKDGQWLLRSAKHFKPVEGRTKNG